MGGKKNGKSPLPTKEEEAARLVRRKALGTRGSLPKKKVPSFGIIRLPKEKIKVQCRGNEKKVEAEKPKRNEGEK